MICLTGDVHHASLRTNDQKGSDLTEVQAAERYVAIAADHKVNVTLFVTGKTFKESPDALRVLSEQANVEIGGHTYTAFAPDVLYRGFGFLFGTHCGPEPVQRWDIRKTLAAAETVTGTRPTSWRDHAYIRDGNTARLLAESGVTVLSDEVISTKHGPEWLPEGIANLPINVIPDHEHLYHAHRTPERVAARAQITPGDFPSESYPPDQWLERAAEQMVAVDRAGGVATILAHPLCMYLADKLATFTRLCEQIAKHQTMFARDAVQWVAPGKPTETTA